MASLWWGSCRPLERHRLQVIPIYCTFWLRGQSFYVKAALARQDQLQSFQVPASIVVGLEAIPGSAAAQHEGALMQGIDDLL